jgi:RimJ/RimL family protein N-acetyltransferase
VKSIDLQPCLVGKTITLRPLRKEDFSELYKAAADPRIWEQHPDSSRYKEDVFEERFFAGAIASKGALAVVHNKSARIIGSSRYYDWDPEPRHIAIGFTFLEPSFWSKGTNQEMKALMLSHIFAYADTVWFHVGEKNLRSRRAVEKLGAILSHSEEREVDGNPYVQLFYKLNSSQYAARQGLAS